jgi:glutaredoxin
MRQELLFFGDAEVHHLITKVVCSTLTGVEASSQANARRHNYLVWAAAAAATAAFAGAGMTNSRADGANQPETTQLAPPAPQSSEKKPSRPITHDKADAPALYQYAICPWCNKAKAVLHYCKVPYHEVEVHPLFKSELSWSQYKKVPVMMLADGEQINGSSEIVDAVWEAVGPKAALQRRPSWCADISWLLCCFDESDISWLF